MHPRACAWLLAQSVCSASVRHVQIASHTSGQRAEDGVPDMTSISDIDVGGVNTNLRVRFGRDEIYTFTGTILVAVNPYQFLPIYEKVSLGAACLSARVLQVDPLIVWRCQ